MSRALFVICLSVIFYSCDFWRNQATTDESSFVAAITVCGNERAIADSIKLNIPDHPRLLGNRKNISWPLIQANDCRESAGLLADRVLEVSLEITWGDFRPETNSRPGVLLAAIGESGKAPSIPAPMIRVEEGTMIRATLINPLSDSSATFYGLHTRPGEKDQSIFLSPGERKTVEFLAGEPGTYLYRVVLGRGVSFALGEGEDEQLVGAFIIDPKGYKGNDRVIVMNIFSTKIDTALWKYGWLEAMAMNGKSWPFSELLRPEIGKKEFWKIINGTQRGHPMHLHGFYYDVVGEGSIHSYKNLPNDSREHVVTKSMEPFSTMEMEWTPSRPGRWLFHCHITYHVTNDIRLPEADKFDDPNSHAYHMSGLVIGLDVADGKSDLIQRGTPRNVSLVANETDTLRGFRMRFSTEDGSPQRPGPMLVLNQYQPTYATVENKMSEPTSVHWHGLELDSWADGVPGWSQSDNKASPEIVPGGKFTYQLSLMHSGTFIYHSHLNDQLQLREGLYGALIVLPEGKVFDPNYDHVYMVGQKMIDDAKFPEDIDVNGVLDQPLIVTEAGSKHRLRLINIGLVAMAHLEMTKANEPITITQIAKDGAALPGHQQRAVLTSDDYGVGETADFEFHAAEPGEYVLKITYYGQTVEQVWKVLMTKPGTISSE